MDTKRFIKENWFRLGILFVFIILIIISCIYLLNENRTKQDKQELVNSCIKDAYEEMKTLQANYDSMNMVFCMNSKTYCSESMENNEKYKKEAFETYENEWMPQCKLGNRVFPDYKYCSPSDMVTEKCEDSI